MVGASVTLDYIALGIVVGAIGQGARAAVGIQKARDEADPEDLEDGSWWDPTRLYASLVIGGVAGALAVILRPDDLIDVDVTQGTLLTLLGVGYAGTDFIEGVLKSRMPGGSRGGDE